MNVTSTTQIKRVYTMNSTIEEIMESPVGREILGKMMAQNPLAQADADDIGMGEAMARMMGGNAAACAVIVWRRQCARRRR